MQPKSIPAAICDMFLELEGLEDRNYMTRDCEKQKLIKNAESK